MNGQSFPRFAESRLKHLLEISPAVIVHGTRFSGKSTLVREVFVPQGYEYYNFGDPYIQRHATEDITGFVSDMPDKVIWDDVQYVPQALTAMKVEIDRRRMKDLNDHCRSNGRYLITCSTMASLLPKLQSSLAGRVMFLELHPLSQCEIHNNKSGILKALFDYKPPEMQHERLGNTLYEKITRGGYPLALAHPLHDHMQEWYVNELQGAVLKDMKQLFRLNRKKLIGGILGMAARQTGKVLSANKIAKDAGVSMPTARKYLCVLDVMFVLDHLSSWIFSEMEHLVRASKLHMGDTGLACALLGLDAQALRKDLDMRRQLLKTFVYQELRRQASWGETRVKFYHFRHRDRADVDIVLRGMGRKVVGVVVLPGFPKDSDLRGLKMLEKEAGDDFVAGFVFYDGEICTKHKGFHLVPIRHLWETVN